MSGDRKPFTRCQLRRILGCSTEIGMGPRGLRLWKGDDGDNGDDYGDFLNYLGLLNTFVALE